MNQRSEQKVSERALEARIKRKLVHEGETLRKCRQRSRWWNDLGDYYVVDLHSNTVIARFCQLEKLGHEVGALKAHEVIA